MFSLAQTITLTFDLKNAIIWLIIALIAGAVVAAIFRIRRIGWIGSIIIGLIGAFIGQLIFGALHLTIDTGFILSLAPYIVDIIVAFVGAFLLMLILFVFFRRY